MAGAGHPAVQRLQFFLSESRWDPEWVNARRLELLAADLATALAEADRVAGDYQRFRTAQPLTLTTAEREAIRAATDLPSVWHAPTAHRR